MALLVFASNAFVPTNRMPGPLRAYADHQPVTATTDAVRALLIHGSAWDEVLVALAWILGISVVFAVLAVRRYRRTV
jgi:ABC-type multidrug transport system permease subunit